MNRGTVSIILVTHNGVQFLEGLCSSLIAAAKVPVEVICVDNGSRDTTIDTVKQYFPDAKVFALSKNTGFSRAANLGAKNAAGEYLFFLNQDMEVDSGVIVSLLKAAQEKKDAGIFGAKMKFARYPDVVNSFGIAINRIGIAWDYGRGESDGEKFRKEKEVLGVCGGALFIRRDLFLSLEGFDERFFMYGEDVDLGLRVLGAGYKAMVIPDATVFHHKGVFWGNTRHFEFLDQKNRWRIVLRYFPPGLFGSALKAGIRFDLISLSRFLIRGDLPSFFYRLSAVIYTLFSLPKVIRKRKITNALSEKLSALIEDGYGLPDVDVSHLAKKRKWTQAQKDTLREEFKKEALPSIARALLLRGTEPEMVGDLYEVLKEIYPDIEVVMLVGDKRKTDGFKGSVLDFFHEKNYFSKFFLEIFRKFDVIFILRKDAILKKMLAILSFPKASFTVDSYGRLRRTHFNTRSQ